MLFYISSSVSLAFATFFSLHITLQSIGNRYSGKAINFGQCMEVPVTSRIGTLLGVTIQDCLYHCVKRPTCSGLNYQRKYQLCDLFTGDIARKTPGDCLYIDRSDITPEQDACNNSCVQGQTCNANGTCVQEGKTECLYPDVTNGKPKGNMFSVGNTQVIECDSEFSVVGPSSLNCLSNGSWDAIPECIKECNLSDILNANVEPFVNSSGRYANVQCHTGYAMRKTGGTGNLTFHFATIKCANNGTWIPTAECIDENNLSNIATNKPTSQSSTYSGYGPERAADGYWNSDFGAGSCTHTQDGGEPIAWWEIDLQEIQIVRRVKILNRASNYFAARFRDVTVTIGMFTNPTHVCGEYVGPARDAEMVDMLCIDPIESRFVRINKFSNTNNLVMCEVGIYEH